MIANLITRFYNFIFNRYSILIGTLLVLLILFHQPIESLITATLVNHLLSYVKQTWYNDAIFYFLALATIVYFVYKWRKYTPSQDIVLFYGVLAAVYVFYRVEGGPWFFTAFASTDYLKYADIVVLLAICNALLLVKWKESQSVGDPWGFVADEPIASQKHDLYGYAPYVQAMATKIKASKLKGAFAIGINGKWGLGKTSFMELLKNETRDKEVIEIAFAPWNSSNPKAIIQDFFETLQEGIAPYHSSLTRLLVSYSNKLVALHDNTVSQSILASVTAFTGFESLDQLFKDINSALKRINKKIIVYVDDLDRLDKDEIMEVIRFIRNTANFYNTFFIVSYDRDYVVNALREHNPHNAEQFLEKIFQLEVTLPYFHKDILRHELVRKIKLSVPEEYHKICDECVIGTPANPSTYLHDWLDSMRDVTRLTNAFTLNFSKLAGEVDLADFLKLELLRMNYPAVYVLLFKNKEMYLELTDHGSSNNYYSLRAQKHQTSAGGEPEYTILTYLQKKHNGLSVPQGDIEKIVSLLAGIFPPLKWRGFYGLSSLSVTNPLKFERYFAYTLLQGNLSEVAFGTARTLNQAEFNTYITLWVQQEAELELQRRFCEIDTFHSQDDFEKVIRGILHLARQESLLPTQYSKLVGYEGKDLKRKLSDYDNRLSNEFYGGGKVGLEKLQAFTKDLFYNAPSPYTYEADFIHFLYDEYTSSFPLTKEELKQLLLFYLKSYCNHVSHFDRQILYLYSRCELIEWEPEDADVRSKVERMPEEATEILKDFILNKDFNGFLLHGALYKAYGNRCAIGVYPSKVFGSRENFKQILQEQDEARWDYLKEYSAFLAEFEAKGGSNFVEFDFQVIPVDINS